MGFSNTPLGLAVVLGLPVLLPFLNMPGIANGVVAGLTVAMSLAGLLGARILLLRLLNCA